ncbi:MAG: TonB-dependent receptor [Acidobacteria bacterium]|nr:TonB-dependent receptor [Acidobacteriota bacterium]MCI0622982.1 TonB-dependent receptor [Acidobacteriota bacterium]MCI0724979.1 TonB-dependent receptor [Acidobacteriota bacterium]
MKRQVFLRTAVLVTFLVGVSQITLAQKAGITGRITDSTGAVLVGANLLVTSVDTGVKRRAASNEEGYYTFELLQQGKYQIMVEMQGFKPIVRSGIELDVHQLARMDFVMELGEMTQTVEVTEDASPLNFETPEVKGTITRTSIEALPLQVSGSQRSAASFVTVLPGVNPGGGAGDVGLASFNGGQMMSDEATLDGVSLQEGLLNQSGLIAIHGDFPIAPEAVGEISVLTSNYDVRYGSSSAAVITATTKAGTNEFHGGAYEFHRNTIFNARQFGVAKRPKNLEHDFGAFLGGPVKAPLLWSSRRKTYFFFHFEGYRSKGSATKPIRTVPTEKMRRGDFSEWPNPIFDPNTTRSNPAFNPNQPTGANNLPFLRDQLMGCDGRTPNVFCPTDPRLARSLAPQWLKHVPLPNRPGITANYESPVGLASGLTANTHQFDVRGDHYIGDNDHISITYHHRRSLFFTQSAFPAVIDGEQTRFPNYSHIARANWYHTFSPTLVNHFAFGYLDLPTKVYNASDCCVDEIPKIPGASSSAHTPVISFQEYNGYGGNADFFTTRPTYVANDTLTWIRGKHTLHFGGEYRNTAYPTHSEANSSGTFFFSNLNTGLLGIPSGNAMASFLLGAVSSANVSVYSLPDFRPKANSLGLFVGDTWKLTSKLNVTLGLRWDMFRPSVEAEDRTSFFDPIGPNPGAGNRPGRLAFAGTKWGAASFGERHPEKTFHKAFAPRVGFAYALTPKTVVRAGYGVFFMQNFYPSWNAGIATDGFNTTAAVSSSLGGLEPAFLLQNGFPFPQNFVRPPFIDSAFRNGQGAPNYRPFDANQLPYSQQWNLTVEHQFTENFYLSAAYIGNKGTRLLSQVNPLNVLDPKLLALGNRLNDQFAPGQTVLNGVSIPYPGWVEQLTGCQPSVAQALLPYPQYCGNIYGQNENVGNSSYHSLQLKAEKRFSRGIWMLASYTLSKTLTDAESAQSATTGWFGVSGVISPYERRRNKSLASLDVPQAFALSFTYQLPFGNGKRFLSKGGIVNRILGGWEVTSIARAYSGTPLFFRSSFCNVPGQFAAGCIPAILPGADPYAQDKGNYDPQKPLFNKAAFESADSFNFYLGKGPRVSNLRGFGYRNQDFGLTKVTQISEKVSIQIRAEAFNVWNWHIFTQAGANFAGFNVVNTDVASPSFGMWRGGVSRPRNIQVGAKIIF